MPGFHAGRRKSGIGAADGKDGCMSSRRHMSSIFKGAETPGHGGRFQANAMAEGGIHGLAR